MTIRYFDDSNKGGILLSIDFKKAFDSKKWNFLYESLEHFGFGKGYINWIKTLYKQSTSCIKKNNGYISETFHTSRGIRQGFPLSSLLFVSAVEILGNRIRSSCSLKGFDFGYPDKPVTFAQYADDTVFFLNNKAEVCSVINLLDEFGKFSGTKLNMAKCEGLWLGKSKQNQHNCKLFGFKWPTVLRCLGVYLGYNEHSKAQLNWTDKLNTVHFVLSLWFKRDEPFW